MLLEARNKKSRLAARLGFSIEAINAPRYPFTSRVDAAFPVSATHGKFCGASGGSGLGGAGLHEDVGCVFRPQALGRRFGVQGELIERRSKSSAVSGDFGEGVYFSAKVCRDSCCPEVRLTVARLNVFGVVFNKGLKRDAPAM
jgi:hypothetical protein